MDEFISAIVDAGLKPPKNIVIDGNIHRFASSNKIRNKDGYYALFDNGNGVIGGFFGCWRMGIKHNWYNKSKEILNDVELALLHKQISERKLVLEKQKQKQNEYAAKKAQEIWENAPPAPYDHPYLTRKQVSAPNLRVDDKNTLMVPVMDFDGNIYSLQFIDPIPNTKKLFLPGGKIKGMFFKIEGSAGKIYLAEGYATAWSIFLATGATVFVAFSAGNLSTVAEKLVSRYPNEQIIIAADNDASKDSNTGKKYAEETAKKYNLPVIWPQFDPSDIRLKPSDFNDLHIICGLDKVKSRLEEASPLQNNCDSGKKTTLTKKSQIDKIIEITKDLYFFENQAGEILVDLPVENHKETWTIKSKKFQSWIIQNYLAIYQKIPRKQSIVESLLGIESIALFNGNKHPTHLRRAKDEDCIYLDLCNEKGEIIKIDKQGWKIIKDCPIKFVRTNNMLSLPSPKRDGKINDLWKIIPVENQNDRILILGWLLQLLNPDGPYPLLIFEGPQGSGKSRTTRVLISLIDPSLATIRTLPSNEQDLFISANNALAIAFDNISKMKDWLSDALCRISTGGSFTTRKLFSDSEETILSAKNPVIINGINQVIDRQDLLDRSIVICLEEMPSDKRIPEQKLQALENNILPSVLGLLLDAASKSLIYRENVKINDLPRMADFVHWVSAGIHVFGVSKEQFLDSYTQNRLEAIEECISSDIVATGIIKLLKQVNEWQGSATELKLILKKLLDPNEWDFKEFPKTASLLSRSLNRQITFLKNKGIQIKRSRSGGDRKITITRKK